MGRKKQPGLPYIKREKGYPYYYVTYEKGKRKTLHRLTWEAANGPVPPGHVIRFRDGNTLNCDLSNLYIDTRAAFANENRRLDQQGKTLASWAATAEGMASYAIRGSQMRKRWQTTEHRQKVLTTRLQRIASGEIKVGFQVASDKHLAYWLFPNRPDLAQFALNHAPDLINARRGQHNLKKQLKKTEQ